jgi:uncharacterized protein
LIKAVLLLLALFCLFFLLRNSFKSSFKNRDEAQASPPKELPPHAMLSCAHCGVHLPRDEALPGRGGVFCDAAHRMAFEQQHPAA